MRPEDLEEIAGVMRPLLQAQGRTPTKLAIQAVFVERVQQYLHLVLCMSPVGDAFRCAKTCSLHDHNAQLHAELAFITIEAWNHHYIDQCLICIGSAVLQQASLTGPGHTDSSH